MEDMVVKDQKPLQACLEDVASCDVYVGIFAWRYGFIPEDKKDNPNKLSITELEYRKACEADIPCLIFLLDDDVSWPRRFSDGTLQSGIKSDDNINRLRNGFKNYYVISKFKNKDELAGLVSSAVNKSLKYLEQKQSTTKRVIKDTTTNAAATADNSTSSLSSLLLQKPLSMLFKGEKSFFCWTR